MTLFKYADIAKLRGLTSTQRLVLHNLTARDNKNKGCFPSINQQAEDTALSEGAVRRALKVLEEGGWIEVDRAPPGSHYGNHYELPFLTRTPAWDDDKD